eukprot:gene794-436_t
MTYVLATPAPPSCAASAASSAPSWSPFTPPDPWRSALAAAPLPNCAYTPLWFNRHSHQLDGDTEEEVEAVAGLLPLNEGIGGRLSAAPIALSRRPSASSDRPPPPQTVEDPHQFYFWFGRIAGPLAPPPLQPLDRIAMKGAQASPTPAPQPTAQQREEDRADGRVSHPPWLLPPELSSASVGSTTSTSASVAWERLLAQVASGRHHSAGLPRRGLHISHHPFGSNHTAIREAPTLQDLAPWWCGANASRSGGRSPTDYPLKGVAAVCHEEPPPQQQELGSPLAHPQPRNSPRPPPPAVPSGSSTTPPSSNRNAAATTREGTQDSQAPRGPAGHPAVPPRPPAPAPEALVLSVPEEKAGDGRQSADPPHAEDRLSNATAGQLVVAPPLPHTLEEQTGNSKQPPPPQPEAQHDGSLDVTDTTHRNNAATNANGDPGVEECVASGDQQDVAGTPPFSSVDSKGRMEPTASVALDGDTAAPQERLEEEMADAIHTQVDGVADEGGAAGKHSASRSGSSVAARSCSSNNNEGDESRTLSSGSCGSPTARHTDPEPEPVEQQPLWTSAAPGDPEEEAPAADTEGQPATTGDGGDTCAETYNGTTAAKGTDEERGDSGGSGGEAGYAVASVPSSLPTPPCASPAPPPLAESAGGHHRRGTAAALRRGTWMLTSIGGRAHPSAGGDFCPSGPQHPARSSVTEVRGGMETVTVPPPSHPPVQRCFPPYSLDYLFTLIYLSIEGYRSYFLSKDNQMFHSPSFPFSATISRTLGRYRQITTTQIDLPMPAPSLQMSNSTPVGGRGELSSRGRGGGGAPSPVLPGLIFSLIIIIIVVSFSLSFWAPAPYLKERHRIRHRSFLFADILVILNKTNNNNNNKKKPTKKESTWNGDIEPFTSMNTRDGELKPHTKENNNNNNNNNKKIIVNRRIRQHKVFLAQTHISL